MAIQPDPILRGAVRWLERIPDAGIARTRSLLVTNPRLSDLTPTQYETALDWIQRTGLLAEAGSGAPTAVQVFETALSEVGWFVDADALVREPDEMPQDALEAAEALGIDEEDAFQHLHSAWGKVDTEARLRVGAAGEAQLVAMLTESVVGDIAHVSQWSDGLGYDIAVSAPRFRHHLEVKSSTRHGRLAFYLSRNEFNVMRRDPHWTLVTLTLSEDLKITAVRTVSSDWIVAAAPRDHGPGGRWESCKFDVPQKATGLGVAAIRSVLHENASPLLLASAP